MTKKKTGLESFFTDISGVDFVAKLDEEKKQKELQKKKQIEEAAEKQRKIIVEQKEKDKKRKLNETKKLSVLEDLFGIQEFKEQIKETIETNAKTINQKSPAEEKKLLESLGDLYGSLTEFAKKKPVKKKEYVREYKDPQLGSIKEGEFKPHRVQTLFNNNLVDKVNQIVEKDEKPYWQLGIGESLPATEHHVNTNQVYELLTKRANQIREQIETNANMSLEELTQSFNKFKQLTSLQLQSIGGGGSVRISEMDDVDTSAQQDGYALKYNASTGQYDFGEVASDLTAVDQNIIPDADGTRDIGSTAKAFNNGYFKNVYVEGTTLEVDTDTTLKGSTTIGVTSVDSTEDTLTINAKINSSLEPLTTLTHDIGSPNRRWRDIYLSGNTIDLAGATISGDGTGAITISATGATLPVGSKVGTASIAASDAKTGVVTKTVPLFTQAGGLSTAATTFTMAAGSSNASVFTAFTKANGTAQSKFELFSF
jgi:hypothetical protein